MNYQIHLRPDPGHEHYNSLASRAAEAALNHQGAASGALAIVLTSSEYIEHLNASFRDTPEPTDVLSFPDGEKDPETNRVYYGDVVVAIPEAEKTAEEQGHSLEGELNLLIVHGVLHLLGFKHSSEKDRQKMWSAQSAVLKKLNNEILEPAPYPSDVKTSPEAADNEH